MARKKKESDWGGARRGQGRKPLPESERGKKLVIYLDGPHRALLRQHQKPDEKEGSVANRLLREKLQELAAVAESTGAENQD